MFQQVVYVLAESDMGGTAISGAKHALSSYRREWYAYLISKQYQNWYVPDAELGRVCTHY